MMQSFARGGGWIEVICGPMFSGKSEELIRRLRLAQIAKQRVQIFKPAIDNRYEAEYITSHSEQKFICTPVKDVAQILSSIRDNTRVVGIDEAQFFDASIVDVCERLANRGMRVIAAGLDQDYLGQPFGAMPQLLAIADSVSKNQAVCVICGGLATKSQRITTQNGQVVVAAGETYEARCRHCFDPDFSLQHSQPKKPVSKELGAEAIESIL